MSAFTDRLMHAWNAFLGREPTRYMGSGSSYRPDRPRISRGGEKSLANTILNRIAVDCASVSIKHVLMNEEGRYLKDMSSGLNNCLTLSANIDQTGRAFIQDSVFSMMDEGCIAMIPVDTDLNPEDNSFEILSLRVGTIVEWFPKDVRIRLYNENTGRKEEIVIAKSAVSIVENPFYSIMNEPNSIMQRLVHKLNIMDTIDEQASSGKLDMIVQLPYTINSEPKRLRAEARRKDIETQLTNSKFGIAYIDSTEHITQLNRSLENNMLKQVEYLQSLFFSQLGITQGILDGTADENTMQHYNNRIIEPILSALTNEMKRKFLTKNARTRRQSIMFFIDPFKIIPVTQLADIADKMTRNEIMTSNEMRQVIGMKPSEDPNADVLRNKNINQSDDETIPHVPTSDGADE